jgi:hypothetical protein
MKNIALIAFFNIFKVCLLTFLSYVVLLSFKRLLLPGIIFYEGISILILIFLTSCIYSIFNFKFNEIKIYRYLCAFFLCLFIHSTVITIIDRSISIFMLDRIDKKKSDFNSIKNDFQREFLNDAISKRLVEQTKSNNTIFNKDSTISLTRKGYSQLFVFRRISKLFNLDTNITD